MLTFKETYQPSDGFASNAVEKAIPQPASFPDCVYKLEAELSTIPLSEQIAALRYLKEGATKRLQQQASNLQQEQEYLNDCFTKIQAI